MKKFKKIRAILLLPLFLTSCKKNNPYEIYFNSIDSSVLIEIKYSYSERKLIDNVPSIVYTYVTVNKFTNDEVNSLIDSMNVLRDEHLTGTDNEKYMGDFELLFVGASDTSLKFSSLNDDTYISSSYGTYLINETDNYKIRKIKYLVLGTLYEKKDEDKVITTRTSQLY